MLRPHIIDGLKYDLRIYVLLAGIDPLRIFIYKEGLARFSTEEYVLPNKKNLGNMCVH
jgi:tubulin polyglutamylase TTLL6/13